MLSKPKAAKFLDNPSYQTLSNLIDEFNNAEQGSFEQLNLLQQIDIFSTAIMENCDADFLENSKKCFPLRAAVFAWRMNGISETISRPSEKEQTLEEVLQSFKIHRDSSVLFRSIEFSAAYNYVLKKETSIKSSKTATVVEESITLPTLDSLYELLSQRYTVLQQLIKRQASETKELQQKLLDIQINIYSLVQQSFQHLSDRSSPSSEVARLMQEHLNITALNLKFKNESKPTFDGYQVTPLQGQNNENYLVSYQTENATQKPKSIIDNLFKKQLKVNAQNLQLVLRIEDRDNSKNETLLKSHKIAKYFVKDYSMATKKISSTGQANNPIDVNQSDENFEKVFLLGMTYKPVALSQYVKRGNLNKVAKKLAEQSSDNLALKTQHYFTQITDFCLQLIQLGIYHPDIKLENFLVGENDEILISDRKTFLNKQKAKVPEIRTSPLFLTPELARYFNVTGRAPSNAHKEKEVDLLPQMAYQVGLCLKAFLLNGVTPSALISADLYREYPNPCQMHQNLGLLSDALTRSLIEHRLSLESLSRLLSAENLNLPSKQFEEKLIEVAGFNPFTIKKSLLTLSTAKVITEEDIKNLLQPYLDLSTALPKTQSLRFLDLDVELGLIELFKTKEISSVSFKEFAVHLQRLRKLDENDSIEDQAILDIHAALQEANDCIDNATVDQESSIAFTLLKQRTTQLQKKYATYLKEPDILMLKLRTRSMTQQDLVYVSVHLENHIKEKSVNNLKEESLFYILSEITAFNRKHADLLDKILLRLNMNPSLSDKYTLNDINRSPDFEGTRNILRQLSPNTQRELLSSIPKLRDLVCPTTSHESMQLLTQKNKGTDEAKTTEKHSELVIDKSTIQISGENSKETSPDNSTTKISEENSEVADNSTTKISEENSEVADNSTTKISEENSEVADNSTTKISEENSEVADNSTIKISKENSEETSADNSTTKISDENSTTKFCGTDSEDDSNLDSLAIKGSDSETDAGIKTVHTEVKNSAKNANLYRMFHQSSNVCSDSSAVVQIKLN